MRERVRRIWFPGLLSLLTTYVSQTIIFRYIEQPKVSQVGDVSLLISLPWLALLLVWGLLSAWVCYYEGGSPRERLLVSQFPVLLMVGMFLLAFGASLILEPLVPLRLKLVAFLGYFVSSVMLPSVALLTGATLMIAREQFGREQEELQA